MLLVSLNFALALVAIAAAWRLGGDPERKGALVLAAMVTISFVGRNLQGSMFHRLDPVAFGEDVAALLCFSLLGINTKRVWPLWAAAFQLLSVGAHIVRAFELDVRPIVYAWMKSGPTWAVMVLLLVGTLGHHRRMSSSGSARSSPS